MKDEYIIVNKAQILERIEELRDKVSKLTTHPDDECEKRDYLLEIDTLEEFVSQSIPLQSVLEQTYEAGKLDKELSLSFDNPKGRYFSSLKLDI